MQPEPSQGAVIAAFVLAGFADLMQLPFTLVSLTGVLAAPSEALDFGLDVVVMAGLSFLLGFQWAVVPALLAEWVPFVDMLPVWTGFVLFIVWKQKTKAFAHLPIHPRPAKDVQEAQSAPVALPSAPAAVANASVEERLARLAKLRSQQLITEEEFTTRREDILEGR